MKNPVWITRAICDAIHADQVKQHGGRAGMRDENALESALARPRNKFACARKPAIPALAAAYAFGLAKNHPYADGNKRVALAVAYTFLGLNGLDLYAPEAEVVTVFVGLAEGTMTESQLAKWFTGHCKRAG